MKKWFSSVDWGSDGRVWLLIRVWVGLVFAYGGLTKLLEPGANFEASVLRYGVFSAGWVPWIARVVPWVEWIFGIFFILGYIPRVAAGVLCFLALSFLVTLGSSRLFLSYGESDCGCFGTTGIHLSLQQVFLLDLANFALTLRMLSLKTFRWSLHLFWLKESSNKDDKLGQEDKRRQS